MMSRVLRVRRRRGLPLILGFSLCGVLAPLNAFGAVYSYVDWTEANIGEGTAKGTITLPDESTVTVSFEAVYANGDKGTLYGAQVDGGSNFWSPDAPFLSEEVENAPPAFDILQLSGGQDQIYKVTLSEPIKDPIMAIVSLGQGTLRTTYDFDSPFTIVSQGAGYWGGSNTALTALPDDILEGYEGHGTIRFVGTFSTFSWTVPTPETWHGFTFAIRTTERLEPTPGAGGAGGAGGETSGGAGGAGAAGETAGGAGGTSSAGSAGEGGASDSAGTGGTALGGAPSGGSAGRPSASGGAGATATPVEKDKDSGCNCSVPSGRPQLPLIAVPLAALVALLRRRRQN